MTLVLAALALWALAWALNQRLANGPAQGTMPVRIAVPLIFGLTILAMWELCVRGLNVPAVILPPPSAIAARFAENTGTLWQDFVQTVLKGALSGFVIGVAAALATAILVDRFDFLRRGLLPIGNFVAALPIVGTAPILVM